MRAAWLARLSTAPCSRIVALLWPRLLPLHPLLAEGSSGQPVELPEPVGSLSARVLDQRGIYLLENGSSAVVHFGPEAPPEHVMLLLGASKPLAFLCIWKCTSFDHVNHSRCICAWVCQSPGPIPVFLSTR